MSNNKDLYQEQYCETHNQHYADFLKQCPICRGEILITSVIEENKIINEILQKVGKGEIKITEDKGV